MKSDLYIDHNESTVAIPIDNNKNSSFLQNLLSNIIQFSKTQFVLTIATIAMLITCIFVPVDSLYLGYFNLRTLATLFCTLAVVAAFSHIHVFEILSKNIVLKLHSLRNATLGLVFITFFGSMLLANDMALLTFLPLGFYVLNSTDNKEHMAFTFIMQNIAANLGGMVTPVIMDRTRSLYETKCVFHTLSRLKLLARNIHFASAELGRGRDSDIFLSSECASWLSS